MLTKKELKMQRRKFSRNPNHDYRGDDLVSRRNYLLIIESHLELHDKLEEAKAEFKSLDEIHTAGKKDAYAKLKKVEVELAACPAKWFAKGQASVKRKNQSGCCCIINDDSDIESVCGAHTEWLEAKLRQLVGNPEPIEAQIEKLAEEIPAEEWEKLKNVTP